MGPALSHGGRGFQGRPAAAERSSVPAGSGAGGRVRVRTVAARARWRGCRGRRTTARSRARSGTRRAPPRGRRGGPGCRRARSAARGRAATRATDSARNARRPRQRSSTQPARSSQCTASASSGRSRTRSAKVCQASSFSPAPSSAMPRPSAQRRASPPPAAARRKAATAAREVLALQQEDAAHQQAAGVVGPALEQPRDVLLRAVESAVLERVGGERRARGRVLLELEQARPERGGALGDAGARTQLARGPAQKRRVRRPCSGVLEQRRDGREAALAGAALGLGGELPGERVLGAVEALEHGVRPVVEVAHADHEVILEQHAHLVGQRDVPPALRETRPVGGVVRVSALGLALEVEEHAAAARRAPGHRARGSAGTGPRPRTSCGSPRRSRPPPRRRRGGSACTRP